MAAGPCVSEWCHVKHVIRVIEDRGAAFGHVCCWTLSALTQTVTRSHRWKTCFCAKAMTPCLSSCIVFFFFSCIHSLNVLTNANAFLPSHFQSFLLFLTPAGYRHVYLEGMTEASIFVHITVHDIYGKVSL